MREVWKTFGHEHIKAILNKQLDNQKLSHAYLFSGPEGIGKKTLALEFAAKILDTEVSKILQHADFSLTGSPEGIPVEEIRTLTSRLSVKPFQGKYTMAIIDSIDRLNTSASNALLKTLEEPPASVILILISAGQVAPTIISRCQNFSFNSFTPVQCEEFLKSMACELPQHLHALCGGSIGKLLALADNPNEAETLWKTVKHLEELASSDAAAKILAVNEFAEFEPDVLGGYLSAWSNEVRSSLAVYPEKHRLLSNIQTGIWQLQSSMNKKLVLQKLFLSAHT